MKALSEVKGYCQTIKKEGHGHIMGNLEMSSKNYKSKCQGLSCFFLFLLSVLEVCY